jgi:hypothetical protein
MASKKTIVQLPSSPPAKPTAGRGYAPTKTTPQRPESGKK